MPRIIDVLGVSFCKSCFRCWRQQINDKIYLSLNSCMTGHPIWLQYFMAIRSMLCSLGFYFVKSGHMHVKKTSLCLHPNTIYVYTVADFYESKISRNKSLQLLMVFAFSSCLVGLSKALFSGSSLRTVWLILYNCLWLFQAEQDPKNQEQLFIILFRRSHQNHLIAL